MIRAALIAGLLASPALGQEVVAPGATVRVLDRMADKREDLHLLPGRSMQVGKLAVTLDECRYPPGAPGESIAHLTIAEDLAAGPVFAGWMSASSPALNALDHARYDVWLLNCDTVAP